MLFGYRYIASVSFCFVLIASLGRAFYSYQHLLHRHLPKAFQRAGLSGHNFPRIPHNCQCFASFGMMAGLISRSAMLKICHGTRFHRVGSARRYLASSTGVGGCEGLVTAHRNADSNSEDGAEVSKNLRRPLDKGRAILEHDMRLLKSVQQSVSSCNRISYALLCVSGGSDSVAMLHLMHRFRSIWTARGQKDPVLEVVHFNHRIRPEADLEANFVKELAASCGVVCHMRAWGETSPNSSGGAGGGGVVSLAGVGMHANAREWRRREASAIRAARVHQLGISAEEAYICTAHHKEDQVETVLLQLIRGSHISNLHGMKAVNREYLKPLLRVSKADLVDYLNRWGVRWMEDPSNGKREYKRNRVRLDLVPLLEDLAGGKAALDRRLTTLASQSEKVGRLIERNLNEASMPALGGLGLPYCSEANGAYFIDLMTAKSKNRSTKMPNAHEGKCFLAETVVVQEEIVHRLLALATNSTPEYDTVRRVAKMCRLRPEGRQASHPNGGAIFDDDDDAHYFPAVGRRMTLSGGWEVERLFRPQRIVIQRMEPENDVLISPLASG